MGYYEVRVYSGDGRLKKVIPAETIRARAWESFSDDIFRAGKKKEDVPIKQCPACKKDYQPLRKHGKFCSNACYRKAIPPKPRKEPRVQICEFVK